MGKASYILSIESPCSENWDQMSLNITGKHCVHCCKDVVDFTGYSDSAILNFLRKNTGNICGRFRADQLERELIHPAYKIPFKYSGAAAMISSFLILSHPVQAKAHTIPFQRQQTITKSPPLIKTPTVSDSTNINFRIIRGKIVDWHTEKPLEKAYVRVEGSNILAFTDSAGNYELFIPKEKAAGSILRVSYYNYSEVLIPTGRLTTINVKLSPETTVLVGAVSAKMVKKSKKKWKRNNS